MLRYIDNQSPWHGEPIGDVRHPLDIEAKWSSAELAAIGLEPIPAASVVKETLDECKMRLMQQVDMQAEEYRMSFLTPGFGQSLTYTEKRIQAESIQSLGKMQTDALTTAEQQAYKPLTASVGIEGDTLWDCAMLVIAQRDAWRAVSDVVEQKRLEAKASIVSASDAISAKTAATVDWTS